MSPDLSIKHTSFRVRYLSCPEIHTFRSHFVQSTQNFNYLSVLFCVCFEINYTYYFCINQITFSLKIRFFKRRFLGPTPSGTHAGQLQAQVPHELLHSCGHRCTLKTKTPLSGSSCTCYQKGLQGQDFWPWAPGKVKLWAHTWRQVLPAVPPKFPALGTEKKWPLGLTSSWQLHQTILFNH